MKFKVQTTIQREQTRSHTSSCIRSVAFSLSCPLCPLGPLCQVPWRLGRCHSFPTLTQLHSCMTHTPSESSHLPVVICVIESAFVVRLTSRVPSIFARHSMKCLTVRCVHTFRLLLHCGHACILCNGCCHRWCVRVRYAREGIR